MAIVIFPGAFARWPRTLQRRVGPAATAKLPDAARVPHPTATEESL